MYSNLQYIQNTRHDTRTFLAMKDLIYCTVRVLGTIIRCSRLFMESCSHLEVLYSLHFNVLMTNATLIGAVIQMLTPSQSNYSGNSTHMLLNRGPCAPPGVNSKCSGVKFGERENWG